MKSWIGFARFASIVTLAIAAVPSFAQTNNLDLICQLAPGVKPQELADAYGIQLLEKTPGAPFARFDVSAEVEGALETCFQNDERVVWFELNDDVTNPEFGTSSKGVVIPAIGDPDALYAQNMNLLDQIHWTPTLASLASRRVKVAVLDTGLSPYATSLWGNVYSTNNCVNPGSPAHDLPDSNYPLTDPRNEGLGHGTMVTGLIVQLAPNADLIVEKVADSSGGAKVWDVIRGVADAVNQHAELCNVSLGTQEQLYGFKQVMAWATAHGMLVIAPAGNDGLPEACSPADLRKVICVTGLLPDNTKAPFSNWDTHAVCAAPATGVKSVWWTGEIGIWSGTSFSAPLVTAGLALTFGEMSDGWNLKTTRTKLEQSGSNLDDLNPDYSRHLGSGLNIQALMQSAVDNQHP